LVWSNRRPATKRFASILKPATRRLRLFSAAGQSRLCTAKVKKVLAGCCTPIVPGPSTTVEAAMGAARSAEGNHMMITIGTFTRTANGYSGSVKTVTLNVKAVKFVPAEGDNDNGPDFRIFADTEFGVAWKKRSDKGNDYLSVKLDDPSFLAPIYCILVDGGGKELPLLWSRRRAAD
jgi:uncharacterized protein (DUF736 family)